MKQKSTLLYSKYSTALNFRELELYEELEIFPKIFKIEESK